MSNIQGTVVVIAGASSGIGEATARYLAQKGAKVFLAVAGVGLYYALEPTVAAELGRGQLRAVLEQYAPEVPGLFLYFPSRAQVSPALKAFVDVARQVTKDSS